MGKSYFYLIKLIPNISPKQFKNMTIFFSQDSMGVAAVIPTMDWLTSHLSPKTGKEFPAALIEAMKLACKKMNHYCSLTNNSIAYCITMVLRPGVKLEYLRNKNWEGEWIEVAENLVYDEYAKYEKPTTDDLDRDLAQMKEANNKGYTSFSNLSVTTQLHQNEVQVYLSLPVENVKDLLKWWYDNRFVYPSLHRMALDYLSIPATSTAVERVFSQGCHLLPFTCNNLSLGSIRAFLCFGSWAHCGLLVFDDVLAAVLSKKNISLD